MKIESERSEMLGQAEYWYVCLLDPCASSADRTAAAQWRASSPAHEAAWQEVQKIWDATGYLLADDAITKAITRAEQKPTGRLFGWEYAYLRRTLVAAAVLVVAVVATIPWLKQDFPPGQSFATSVGEQRTISLGDGSRVVLDTASTITVRLMEEERRVDIERGQADFQVTSDKERPFVVYAAGGAVTAVGTRFQVRADGTSVSVVLLEGAVKVESPESQSGTRLETRLKPGQRLQFDSSDSRWNKENIDLESFRSWAEGSLFAKNWRLGDLLVEMNRYSRTQLLLADQNLANLPISGTFKVGDHTSLVLALEHGWAIHAKKTKPDEIVLSK